MVKYIYIYDAIFLYTIGEVMGETFPVGVKHSYLLKERSVRFNQESLTHRSREADVPLPHTFKELSIAPRERRSEIYDYSKTKVPQLPRRPLQSHSDYPNFSTNRLKQPLQKEREREKRRAAREESLRGRMKRH